MAIKIAVDFDGTLVEHKFPDIGRDVPGAFEWIKKWQEAGAKLILWTMRSDRNETECYLHDAVSYCLARGIAFDGVNSGIGDRRWTNSPKAYANIYVDDAAFGCPLTESKEAGARPMVDWDIVGPAVMKIIEDKAHGNKEAKKESEATGHSGD